MSKEIVKADLSALGPVFEHAEEKFLAQHAQRIIQAQQDHKSRAQLEDIILGMSADYTDKLLGILARLEPSKKGMLGLPADF